MGLARGLGGVSHGVDQPALVLSDQFRAPHVNEPEPEPEPEHVTRLLGGTRSQDQLGQHGDDASEHVVSEFEVRLVANTYGAADVECRGALGRRASCESVEPCFLSRAEFASSFCRVEADGHRGASELIGERGSASRKRLSELFSVRDELEAETVGVELTVIEVSHHLSVPRIHRG